MVRRIAAVLFLAALFVAPGAFAQLVAPFAPGGATVAVDSSAAQQASSNTGVSAQQYRIRNTGAAAAYIGWASPNTVSGTPAVNTTAPVVGTPQAGVVGMLAQSVEVFTLPPGAWFKASVGGTFEVTPGQGM